MLKGRILFIAIILLAILFVAWYFSDSIALRFIILFLGVMSSLYAIVDVWVDGVVHKKDAGSDCRVFAEHYHRVSQKDEERVREGKYSYPEERSVRAYISGHAVVDIGQISRWTQCKRAGSGNCG